MDQLTVVRSVWSNGDQLLASVTEDEPLRFFHPIPPELDLPAGAPVGGLVSVIILIQDRELEFHLHARVIDRRSGSVRRGMTLECIPDEQDRGQLVLMAARGESLPYRKRRHRRISCRLPCVLDSSAGSTDGVTTNVNAGGLFVLIEEADLPAVGEKVVVRVTLAEGRIWEHRGRTVSAVENGIERGVGIEFLFRSAEERASTLADITRLGTGSGVASA